MLNALALVFISQTDECIYAVFAPHRIDALIQDMAELHFKVTLASMYVKYDTRCSKYLTRWLLHTGMLSRKV